MTKPGPSVAGERRPTPRGLERFNRTREYDVDLLAPNFELHQASSIIGTAGVFQGRDAFCDVLRELQEAFEELSWEAEKFIEAPDGEIVVFIRARTVAEVVAWRLTTA